MHSVALRTQFRIEPRNRKYAPQEQARLVDLFGEPARWGENAQPAAARHGGHSQWPGSRTRHRHRSTVPLTYDLDIASTKFCHGLADGEIPLLLLFAGTVYYSGRRPACRSGRCRGSEEATFRLPVATWRAAMDDHYPGSTFIRLSGCDVDALARLPVEARDHNVGRDPGTPAEGSPVDARRRRGRRTLRDVCVGPVGCAGATDEFPG